MASSSKKKTTMAKIMRENKVREKAMLKRARKDQRKYEAANPPAVNGDEPAQPEAIPIND